jgi:hypothetical protein
VLRTEPLRAMVIGAFVRGLSMRDVESLCEKAGLGKLSKSTASRICEELRERFGRSSAARSTRSASRRSPRRRLPTGPPRRAEGGRAGRLGVHRRGRARAALGDARDARVASSSAGPPPTASAAPFTAPATWSRSCPRRSPSLVLQDLGNLRRCLDGSVSDLQQLADATTPRSARPGDRPFRH